MQLSLQLTREAAEALGRALSGESAQGEARALLDAARAERLNLRRLHPGAPDSSLGRYFVAELPKEDRAEEIRARFAGLAGVSAAYLKPSDALPGGGR